MAKKKSARAIDRFDRAMQWKVVRDIKLSRLDRMCEEWSGRGWTVFQVLGPFSDGFAILLNRIVTLSDKAQDASR